MNIRYDANGRPYCWGTTKKGKPCNRIDVKENGLCDAHQTQGNTTGAMAASFRDQSEETKRFVLSKVEEIEGACPTCGLTTYINNNGVCEPCSIFYSQNS